MEEIAYGYKECGSLIKSHDDDIDNGVFKDTIILTSFQDGNELPLHFYSQYFDFPLSFKSFTVSGKKDYEENFVLILMKYFAEY